MPETGPGGGSPPLRVLVVEDNAVLRRGIGLALAEAGASVSQEGNGQRAVALLGDLRTAPFDVVVTDLRLPGDDGFGVLAAARERDCATRVIVMTAYGSVESAVEAMRRGAGDFIQKPFDLEQLECRVRRSGEAARRAGRPPEPSCERAAGDVPDSIVAESQAMREAIELVRRVAPTRSTVLITGETGTGKEVIAGLVHTFSDRAGERLVKVNCAALPETLLESELFGHERGAFTGADQRRVGRFEEASRGTLLLDEIGDMTLATQAKLLRVLQDQEFYRLGGTRALRTHARIVAATNRDLAEAKRSGAFREDLYFRLDVIGIHLSPLRERPEDLRALAERMTEQVAREFDRPGLTLGADALERIRTYAWPGNVRELRNAIERAALTSASRSIGAGDLALGDARALYSGGRCRRLALPPEGISLRDAERELVVAALERSGYVQKEAATLLGISRRKLNYMIGRMGLTHPSWRRNRGATSMRRAAGAATGRESSS